MLLFWCQIGWFEQKSTDYARCSSTDTTRWIRACISKKSCSIVCLHEKLWATKCTIFAMLQCNFFSREQTFVGPWIRLPVRKNRWKWDSFLGQMSLTPWLMGPMPWLRYVSTTGVATGTVVADEATVGLADTVTAPWWWGPSPGKFKPCRMPCKVNGTFIGRIVSEHGKRHTCSCPKRGWWLSAAEAVAAAVGWAGWAAAARGTPRSAWVYGLKKPLE